MLRAAFVLVAVFSGLFGASITIWTGARQDVSVSLSGSSASERASQHMPLPHAESGNGGSLEPVVVDVSRLDLPQWHDEVVGEVLLPQDIRRLDGRLVLIRGYMYPVMTGDEVPGLALIPEAPVGGFSAGTIPHCAAGPERTRIRFLVPVLLRNGDTIKWDESRLRNPLEVRGRLSVQTRSESDEELRVEWILFVRDATVTPVDPRPEHRIAWVPWGGC
jgi:hypothetical protein